MQGGRSIFDSYPETIDLNQRSIPSNAAMDQSAEWDIMLNPLESRMSNCMHSAGEGTRSCPNAVGNNARSFSGWDPGESSSNANPHNRVYFDETSYRWPSTSGISARSGEQGFEQTAVRSAYGDYGGNHATGRPTSMQHPGSSHSNLDVSLTAGYAGHSDGRLRLGTGPSSNFYKSARSQTEHLPFRNVASDNVGTSSGTSGYFVEESDGSDSSPGLWGSSCKRKALEGSSGHSSLFASSSSNPPADNFLRHAAPARDGASSSLSISSHPQSFPSARNSEHVSSRIGIGMRGIGSDMFPPFTAVGNGESSVRNFGFRTNGGHQDSVSFALPSSGTAVRHRDIGSTHHPSRPVPTADSTDVRSPVLLPMSSNNSLNLPHAVNVPGFSRGFAWNGPSDSRVGASSSSSILSRDGGTSVREDQNFSSSLRNSGDHSMFASPPEVRNVLQEPNSWSLATGSTSSRNVPSNPRSGISSSVHPFSTVWLPHRSPSTHNPQRFSEYSPWTLFPHVELESGGQRNHYPPLSSASSSPEEAVMSSGSGSRGHHQAYSRSALLMEMPGDESNGWHALAADVEGRHRLVSEILNAMRSGGFRHQVPIFDPFMDGLAEFHDMHEDMRMDTDSMTYEELLALEEQIGDVCTGLNEKIIMSSLKQRKYQVSSEGSSLNVEPCCICQEEYAAGDDTGVLDCGHEFHTNCIKKWLTQKNLCPICKMTALKP